MNPKFYTFLDDVNGLENLPSDIYNFIIYWDSYGNIIEWADLRHEELIQNLEQYIPTLDDVPVIREFLYSIGA